MKDMIKVAVGDFPPLVSKNQNHYVGFEIDLWEAVAKDAKIENYEYSQLPLSQVISQVAEKKFDIGLSGITINFEREEIIDFSHPTLDSGLLILVNNRNGGNLNLIKTIKSFFREAYRLLFTPLLFTLLFVFVSGNLLWLVERDAHTFSPNYFPAIFESFWFIISAMSTDSFGDYIPHTWLGRLVTALTIVGGVAVFGFLIAKLTAFFTVKKIKGEINDYHDLFGKTVATVESSTSEHTLREIGAHIVPVTSFNTACEKLSRREVDAVVFDAPAITSLLGKGNKESEKFKIIGDLFEKQKYGIILQSGSDLRERVNQSILRIRESGAYDAIYRKWFGDEIIMEV